MKRRLLGALGVLAIATAIAGCASPVYKPPEPSHATTHCPTGQVVMCMLPFATRMKNPARPFCMCQDAAGVQR